MCCRWRRTASRPPAPFAATSSRTTVFGTRPSARTIKTIYIATDSGGIAEALAGGTTSTMKNPGAILAFTYTGEGDGAVRRRAEPHHAPTRRACGAQQQHRAARPRSSPQRRPPGQDRLRCQLRGLPRQHDDQRYLRPSARRRVLPPHVVWPHGGSTLRQSEDYAARRYPIRCRAKRTRRSLPTSFR